MIAQQQKMPVLIRPPPPAYRERYPEGRDRLLALSEQKPPLAPHFSTSSSASPLSPPANSDSPSSSSSSSASTNLTSRPPKMGLRSNNGNDKKAALRQLGDQQQQRPATMYASEQSLPDRLTQALRALRPAALSHSSSGSSPFRNKNGAVAADDVVYYAGSEQQKPPRPQPAFPTDCTKEKSYHRPGFVKYMNPVSVNNNCINNHHGLDQLPANSLEQLRQLYKSAPDFGALDQCPPQATNGNGAVPQWQSAAVDECSPYAAQSPTDSGYRSAPRHLDSSSSALDDPVEQLQNAVATRVAAFPNQATVVHVSGSPTMDTRKQAYANSTTADSLGKCSLSTRSFSSNGSASSTRRGNGHYLPPPTTIMNVIEPTSISTVQNVTACNGNPPEITAPSTPNAHLPLLVKLQSVPWTDRDVVAVLQRGRIKEFVHRIGVDVVPKLSAILERPLVRLGREIQRLSIQFAKCTQNDVKIATKVILNGCVADSCLKAGIQASTIYVLSGSEALRQSMSRRAGTRLSVGKFLRWMVDARVGICVSEQAAVFLTAVMECLLEEVILTCLPKIGMPNAFHRRGAEESKSGQMLTGESFDSAIADSAELWGLLQPYEHLISSRNAKGQLCLHHSGTAVTADAKVPIAGEQQRLLATCVGSITELDDLVHGVMETNSTKTNVKSRIKLSNCALDALFYFMRCSQLEHQQTVASGGHDPALQTLTREKPYLVLPPLSDWLHVCAAFAERRSCMEADAGDVMQAARVLLPAVDCPPRSLTFDGHGTTQDGGHMKRELAFRMLLSANNDLVSPALQLLGPMRHRTVNNWGLTVLAEAVITGNESAAGMLIAMGADVNIGVPIEAACNERCPTSLLTEFAGWTPLTWAISQGNLALMHALIDACADIDNQSMVRESPLQLAAMMGDCDAAARLVACGGDPFRSSINYDAHSADFRHVGAPSAFGLAAAHGHRALIHMMLTKGQRNRTDEPITLKDFLSESSAVLNRRGRAEQRTMDSMQSCVSSASAAPILQLSKMQQRSLTEALYYAAETAHLDIAIDLRNLGIQWNTHTWLQCVKAAHEQKRRGAVVALLGDFSPRLADELETDTIDEAVPLLFDVLRYECRMMDGDPTSSAAIISRLYTRASGSCSSTGPTDLRSPRTSDMLPRPTIDPRFVNNCELSDVEDRIFYAHRIVLVNASEEFKRLLDSPKGQIDVNDVSYDVFERKSIESLQSDCEVFMLEHLSTMVDDAAVRRALQHSSSVKSVVWADLTGSLASRLAAALDTRPRRL